MWASIFFEFNLPNAASWFYFSLFLTIGLFFKFNRILSVRNADLLALFALVPGFLLLQEGHAKPVGSPNRDSLVLAGYIWLLGGSGYWLVRCLVDLSLVRRPVLTPNLNFAGLAWLTAALFVCLIAVAVRRDPAETDQIGKASTVLNKVQDGARAVVTTGTGSERAAEVEFWVTRGAALVCHLAILVGLYWVGATIFRDTSSGMAAAALYVLVPYTAYHTVQVYHLWPAALVLWAVAAWRRPVISGSLMGVAAGTAFFPLLLAPIWLNFYRGRGAGRFLKAFLIAAGSSLGIAGILLLIDGKLAESVNFALTLSDWQPWRIPQTESIWIGAHWAYRMPVFIAYIGLLVLTAFWPAPKNLAQLIAQSACLLLGVQFWLADQGGVFVLWYLPLLILMIFRPNLSGEFPPEVAETPQEQPRRLRRWVGRLLGSPPPPERVNGSANGTPTGVSKPTFPVQDIRGRVRKSRSRQ